MEGKVKEKVKEYYGGIASNINKQSGCGCGSSCCDEITKDQSIYNVDNLKNIPKDAISASLGCANPLLFANLKEGETVLDLGSGGGIDVLIASKYVGETGKVYGLDMTDEMLALANKNKAKMGANNVEFLKGYIEEIPLPDKTLDVIMSNCVINLSEDKEKALSEAYRVLKDGGRLAIADIVTLKKVPDDLRKLAELWVSCIAGTLEVEVYQSILKKVGFKNIEIKPAHVYTKAVMKDIIDRKEATAPINLSVDLDLLDGAFAGAYVTATK